MVDSILFQDGEKFKDILDFELNDFINRLNPDISIARNYALRENVFALFASMINKIPIYITGSPGQSKTLSMNLVLDGIKMGSNDD